MDNLRLGVEWDLDESTLKAGMDAAKKEISGAGQTMQDLEQKVKSGIMEITTSSEQHRAILDNVSKKYKNLMTDALSAYNSLSPATKNYHDQLSKLSLEAQNIAKAQQDLNASYEKGMVSQNQYRLANQSLIVQQNRVQQSINRVSDAVKIQDNAERQAIGSISQKTARLTQLQQRYQSLSQAQRDHLQVGGKIRAEYQSLTKEVEELNRSLSGTKSQGIGDLLGSLRGIAGGLGIAFSAQQLISFGKELFEIAKQAEGVELAFARMGDTKALERLRVATKNTVNDLELMKLAVRANNFKIPMEVLARGLEFAQRRAADTGQEVDYMVNSFVDGLGRKSSMVLDNLGISLVEIQEEVKKVGDYNIAVGNIIEREMSRAGDAVDTLSTKTGRLSTIWQNFKKEISTRFFSSDDIDPSNIEKRTEFLQTPVLYNLSRAGSDGDRQQIIDNLIERKKRHEDIIKSITEEHRTVNAFMVDQEAISKKYGKSIKDVRLELEQRKNTALEEGQAINNALNNAIKKNDELNTKSRHGAGIYSIEELRAKISDLTSARDKLTEPGKIREANKEIDLLSKKLEELSGSNRKKETDAASKLAEEEAKRRKHLLDQWALLDADFLEKTLDKDEQEIQSAKRKYAELRKEIEKYNKNAKGDPVLLEGLADSEQKSISSIRARHANTQRLQQYQEDYENYLKYEKLKNEVGEQYADAQLGKFKNVVEQMMAEVAGLQGKKFTSGLSPIEESYLKELEERLGYHNQIILDGTRQRFVDAMKLSETFGKKEVQIHKKFADAYEALEKSKTSIPQDEYNERLKALKKSKADELKLLVESHPEYEEAMNFIDNASLGLLPKALKQGREITMSIIQGMDLTSEQRKKLEEQFEEWFAKANFALKEGQVDVVVGLVDGFGSLVQMASQFDGKMSTALKTVGAMVSQVGQLARTIGETMGEVGQGLASTGSGYAAIAGAVLSVFGAAWQIFEDKASRAEQQQLDSMNRRVLAMRETTNLLQEQVAIIQNMFGTDRVDAWKNAQITAQKEIDDTLGGLGTIRMLTGNDNEHDNRMSQLLEDWDNDEKAMEDRLADIKKRQADRERGALSGGSPLTWLLGGKLFSPFKQEIKDLEDALDFSKSSKKYILSWKSIEDITHEGAAQVRADIKNGKFDEATAAELTKILDQWDIYKEAQRQIFEEILGFSFDSILQSTAQLFEETGFADAKAYNKGFDEAMKDFVLKKMQREYLEKEMKVWYDNLYSYAEDGVLDEQEVKKSREDYNKIMEESNRRNQLAIDSLGYDPFASNSANQAESNSPQQVGRINRAIEEATASQILGFERARYDLAVKRVTIAETSLEFNKRAYDLNVENLRHQAAIAQNTADTVTEVKLAVIELKAINKNTNSKTGRDNGFG